MSPISLNESQRRWLEGVLSRGSRDGAISAEQAQLLAAQFETEDQSLGRMTRATAFGMLAMSALLLATGTGFFVQSELLSLSLTMQGAIFISAVTVVQVCAISLRFRGWIRECELLCLLASLLCVAQFDPDIGRVPDGLLRSDRAFVIGLLLLAMCADSLLLHLFLALGLAVSGYIELSMNQSLQWLDPLHLLVLGLLPGFCWGYRRRSAVMLGTAATLAAGWVLGELSRWDTTGSFIAFGVLGFGVMFLLLAELHVERLALGYRWPGVMLVGSTLSFIGLEMFWNGIGHDTRDTGSRTVPSAEALIPTHVICQSFAVLTFTLLFAVVVRQCWLRREAGQTGREMVGPMIRRLWFPLVLTAAQAVFTVWHSSSVETLIGLWIVPIECANLAALALAVYLVDVGVRDARPSFIAAGALCLFRVLYLMAVNNEQTPGTELGTGIILGLFSLIVAGAAVIWLRAKPARRDSVLDSREDPGPWVGPQRLESILGWCCRRSTLLMACALLVQLAVLASYVAVKVANEKPKGGSGQPSTRAPTPLVY